MMSVEIGYTAEKIGGKKSSFGLELKRIRASLTAVITLEKLKFYRSFSKAPEGGGAVRWECI